MTRWRGAPGDRHAAARGGDSRGVTTTSSLRKSEHRDRHELTAPLRANGGVAVRDVDDVDELQRPAGTIGIRATSCP
jgi:hypothetical protein